VRDEPAARILNLSGVYRNTRNIAALELPAKLLAKRGLSRANTIESGSTFFIRCRADRVE
jgi:hypothetical protein